MYKDKVYQCWLDLRRRCKSDPRYKNILVCAEWQNSFETFYADMGDPPTAKHSIDRKDNLGNYEPSNCRWATQKEQNRNQNRNHLITFAGKTQCLVQWAEEYNLDPRTLCYRINSGWTIEEALTARLGTKSKAKKLEFNGKKQTVKEWAREIGLKPNALSERLRRGWSVEEALTTPPMS